MLCDDLGKRQALSTVGLVHQLPILPSFCHRDAVDVEATALKLFEQLRQKHHGCNIPSGNGDWRTAGLKEYPPSLCRSIAHSFFTAATARPIEPAASEPSEAFLAQCKVLVQSEYGTFLGQDSAAKT